MEDLTNSLNEWVAAGLIDQEQADAIRGHERGPSAPEDERRIPLIAEVIGYVGGLLALIAILILVGDFWTDLETWAQLLIVFTGTVIFLGAGLIVRDVDHPAVRRLSSFALALGTVGVAYWFGTLADAALGWDEESTLLLAAAAGLAAGLAVYRLSKTSLQQILLGAGVLVVALSSLAQLDQPPEGFYGLAVWGVGVVWLLLGWGDRLLPKRTAYAIGSLAVLIGPQVMSFDQRAWGLLLGVATAAGLLALSVTLRSTVLLGFGAAGVFILVPQVIFEYFGDAIGVPLALFITGVVLLAVALLIARLRTEVVTDSDDEITNDS